MKAGYAHACVNPPVGMPLEGLGVPGGCTRIHDDLFVRALYLEHAGESALVIGCDLLFFERPVIDRYKGAIGRRLDLAPSQILLNCSHNHAGPRLSHWAYSDGADPLYLDFIERQLVESACRARQTLREVTVWAGLTRTDLPISRRKPRPDGKVEWKPYRKGVICDALPICVLKEPDGRVLSLLFSVSCHPSMWYQPEVSAEYPGVATRLLNAHFKTDGALFLQGAGGDAKPAPVAEGENRWMHEGAWADVEKAGGGVADAVIRCVEAGLRPVQPDLRSVLTEFEWPMVTLPPREYYEAVARGDDPDDFGKRPERQLWAKDMLRQLDCNGRLPTAVPVILHALQIGQGLRLIGLEGEVVGELGLLMLKHYPQGITFPLGYTDGTQLYLPTARMFPEGGYEATCAWEYHWPAPLAPEGERVFTETLCRLRDEGAIPG